MVRLCIGGPIKDIRMKKALPPIIFLLLVASSPTTAYAQYQPGSTGYNTVVVPGNSLGKESRREPDSWGAFSLGVGGKFGWSEGARTEREARRMAQADCVRNGGTQCEVEQTFVNACSALAWGIDNWATRAAPPRKLSLEEVEADALARCGPDCTIIRSSCPL